MKLGILDAVPPYFYKTPDAIRDAERFMTLLRAVGFEHEIVAYHVADHVFPADVHECDAYLVTGSPSSAYDDDPWIPLLMDFIRQVEAAKVPLVGICFGHQVIASALGGRVERAQTGWQAGLYAYEMFEPPAWLPDSEGSSTVRLYHLNRDQVVQIPPTAEHRGTSAACRNTMYTIGDHVLSIQGHPEMPLDVMRGYLANELRRVVPANEQEYAQRSTAAHQPDDTRVGRWIRTFIEMER